MIDSELFVFDQVIDEGTKEPFDQMALAPNLCKHLGESMKREFFCNECGLFFWQEMYSIRADGRIDRVTAHWKCPECHADNEEEMNIWAVDSTGFAYFSLAYEEYINRKSWSSTRHAPEMAIHHYRQNGMKIKP